MTGYNDQSRFEIRCEWGLHGLEQLLPGSDVVIIVDVLSFTTCVDIAVSRGAVVYPYKGDAAAQFAQEHSAILASRDRDAEFSLSPHSLLKISGGTTIVLPSPNGSALSTATDTVPTFAACLRNARSVAHAAQQVGSRIAVIPAGERWRMDGSLRPALEDWLGAGAVISALKGHKSYEAQTAEAAFRAHEANLLTVLNQIGSGIELTKEGFAQDVKLAAQLHVSDAAPRLNDGAYSAAH